MARSPIPSNKIYLCVNLAVRFDMVLGGLFGMFQGARFVAMGQVGVMTGSFVKTFLVMTGGFAMMPCSVFVMLRCLLVMVRCFVRHGNSSRRAGIVAAREDYVPPSSRRGLQGCKREMKRIRVQWRTDADATSTFAAPGPGPGSPPSAAPGRDRRETSD